MTAVAVVGLAWLSLVSGDIGPEVRLDDDVVPGLTPGQQQRPVGASYDGGAFFAWLDSRSATAWPTLGVGVLRDGDTALNTWVKPTTDGAHESPAVACGRSTCFVVWASGMRIFGRRFSFDGQPIDAAPLALSGPNPDYHETPSVAFNGTRYVVVWSNITLQSTTVEEVGLRAGTLPLVPGFPAWPRVVSSNQGLVIAYLTTSGLEAHYAPHGGTFGPAQLVHGGDSYYEGIAAAGSDDGFLLGHVTHMAELYAARFDATGGLLDAPALHLATANPPYALAGVDGGFLVVWREHDELRAQPVPLAGPPGASTRLLLAPNELLDDVALAGGASPVAAYSRGYPEVLKLRAVRLSGLNAGPEVRPVARNSTQVQPAVSWSGSGFLAAWVEERADAGINLRARRLDELGQPQGGTIAVASTSATQLHPNVVWDGSRWLVAWYEEGNGAVTRAATIDAQGVASPPFAVSTEITRQQGERPALALTDAGVVAAWSTWRGNGATVSSALVGSSSSRDLVPSPEEGLWPSLASTPANLLVAWVRPPWGIWTARLQPNGAPAASRAVQDGGAFVDAVAVAGGEDVHLLTWATGDLPTRTIQARRLDDDGLPLGRPMTLATSLASPSVYRDEPPQAVFDGRRFVVAFSAFRADGGSDIDVVTVTPDGGVGALLKVAGGPTDETEAALAAATTGRVLVAYRVYDEFLGTSRVATRLVTAVPVGARCLRDEECVEGICRGFICCQPGACGDEDGGVTSGDGGPQPPRDGGADDGGVGDGGLADGGLGDGGTSGGADAGDGEPRGPLRVGCDCDSTQAGVLSLLALLLAAARRRRAHGDAGR